MPQFDRTVDLPLLAKPGNDLRAEIAARYEIDPGRRWVLLSFSTLEWDEAAVREACRTEVELLTIRPLTWEAPNFSAIDRQEFAVTDLFATVDVVLTKPGFGVVSECIANQKPMIWVDRDSFRETPALVRGNPTLSAKSRDERD